MVIRSRIKAHSPILSRRWSPPMVGWGLSLVIHVLLALILVMAGPAVVPVLRHCPAHSSFETPSDPLVLETTVEKLQMDPLTRTASWVDSVTPQSSSADIVKMSQTGSNDLLLAGNAQTSKTITVQNGRPRLTSQFCGTAGSADRVCFVVDISGSMIVAHDYIRRQLIQTVSQLGPTHRFSLIFFAGDSPQIMPPGYLVRAGAHQRAAAIPFIRQAGLRAVSRRQNAAQAVSKALKLAFSLKTAQNRPVKLIYLFTDGAFDHDQVAKTIQQLQHLHAGLVTLNVIACGNEENGPFLRQLAQNCRGEYRFITDEELSRPAP